MDSCQWASRWITDCRELMKVTEHATTCYHQRLHGGLGWFLCLVPLPSSLTLVCGLLPWSLPMPDAFA